MTIRCQARVAVASFSASRIAPAGRRHIADNSRLNGDSPLGDDIAVNHCPGRRQRSSGKGRAVHDQQSPCSFAGMFDA